MSVVANVAVNVDARNAIQRLRDVQGQAEKTERSFGGLIGAATKLAAAFAGIQAIKFVFVQAAEIQTQTRSLEVLVGSAEKARVIIKQLQDIGEVTPFTSAELIDSAKRLQAFGVETEKVVETTRRLADVSGATGAELQGLVTAYGQVQAKGRLQGEELLQFQERGVALQKVLKDEYKLSGDEFQKALSKGQISAEAVEYALKKLTDAGGKYANGAIAQSDTLNGKLSTLQDSFQRLAQNIGKFFEPVFKFLIEGITRFINRLNDATVMQDEITARNQAVEEARTKFGRLNLFAPGRGEFIAQREKAIFDQLRKGRTTAAPKAPTISGGAPPPLLSPTGDRGTDRAANEAKKIADELQRSLKTGDQLFIQFSRQAVLIGETSDTERKRLQIQYDYQDRAEQIAELKNAEQRINLTALNDEIKRLEILQLQTDELKKQIDEFYRRAGLEAGGALPGGAGVFRTDIDLDPNNRASQKADELKQKFDALIDPINMAATGAQGIGNAFGTAFQSIVTGAQSTQEALASFFQSVGNSFISMATDIIAQMVVMFAFKQLLGLFGGGNTSLFSGAGPVAMPGAGVGGGSSMFMPGAPKLFATGGFVTSPTRAIVGEGGEPEYVIPASKMRGAMNRYASGARGSSVIPQNGDGAMAGGGGGTFTLETVVINNVEYATVDQVRAMGQQAASQGAQGGFNKSMRTLQNSRSQRARIGLR